LNGFKGKETRSINAQVVRTELLKVVTRQNTLDVGLDAEGMRSDERNILARSKPRQRGARQEPLFKIGFNRLIRTSRSPQDRTLGLLKRKRVLVTGGAGFVGSHLVDLLVECGCSQVIVVDNMFSGNAHNLRRSIGSGKVKLVVGDIRDEALMEDLVAGVDTVFHHAAIESAQCVVEPRLALEVMASATFNLFDRCVRSGVRKIVMASSASVYGTPAAFPTPENHDHNSNRTLFGAIKSFGEALLRSFNEMYGMNYLVLRYFDVYGPRMCFPGSRKDHLVRWIERIDAGLPPIVIGDGSQTIDLLDVEDAARANLLAAVSPASDMALNVGSGEEMSHLSLVRALARIMGRAGIEPMFWEDRPFNTVSRCCADTQSARQAIGFEARVPLADGLVRLVDWWRSEVPARGLH